MIVFRPLAGSVSRAVFDLLEAAQVDGDLHDGWVPIGRIEGSLTCHPAAVGPACEALVNRGLCERLDGVVVYYRVTKPDQQTLF